MSFFLRLIINAAALWVAVVFRALDALRVFDLIYVLTPNSPDTMSMSSYARQQAIEFKRILNRVRRHFRPHARVCRSRVL